MSDNSYINNPLLTGNKLLLPTETESIEISNSNFFKYFKNVYVLVKKNDIPFDKNCFMKQINETTFKILSDNLVLWKCTLNIIKNKINFDKTVILQDSKLADFNQFDFKLEKYNLVLPILTVSFKNILTYLENKNGESSLEKIYNNVILTSYFKDDTENIKNKYQFERMINSMDEATYWSFSYNCLTNLSPVFKIRKFNNIFMKKLKTKLDSDKENENTDYLAMVLNKNKYMDAASIIKKNGFKLYNMTNKSIYSKKDINKLFLSIIDDKQKYLLFCNMIVSKKHCALVLNNDYILDFMKPHLVNYAPLFRYLIGYAWLRFYFEESIKKSNLKTSDDIIFDINTASKLPIFPFSHDHPKYNPYMPIMVSDEQLDSYRNICGLKEFAYPSQTFNKGICNLDEFRKNLRLFTTSNAQKDLFNNVEWVKNKIAISGSVMTACIQKEHPLMHKFTDSYDDKIIRYFNEYYPTSDIDVMVLTQDPLDYMKNVNEFFNQIVVNICIMNSPYAEANQVRLNPLFQAHIIVKENWIMKNIANENLTYNFIYSNIEESSIKSLFMPFFKLELEKKKNEEMKDKDIDIMKRDYPDYFLDYDKYDIKIHIYGDKNHEETAMTTDMVIKINYKYRINSPHLNHPLELFMAKGDDFMSLVSQFHLPCVRSYYDGTNVYMTPSCVSSHLTYMNLDYKYFAGTKDPIEIINKNRMRGFGTWLNKNEIQNLIQYSNDVDFWKNMYGKGYTIKGPLPINHTIFHPRMVNQENYYDCAPISLENSYKSDEYPTVSTLNELDDKLLLMNGIKKKCFDMQHFNSIDKEGAIVPLKKWIIEAYYEFVIL